MFRRTAELVRVPDRVFLPKRAARIPLWQFLKSVFQERSNPEAAQHRKRIAGFQPVKTELNPNRTYYWCSCGYAQHQALCDQSCQHMKGAFQPLKFTSPKYQLAELCMCKLTTKAPYCDQSCHTRFAGMQMKMGNGVEGTFSNMKTFLDTVPKGIDNYRQFANERQAKLEYTDRLKKKMEKEEGRKK